MSAASGTSRSKPKPVTVVPAKAGTEPRNASELLSITATLWSRDSRLCASVEPTPPQPMSNDVQLRDATRSGAGDPLDHPGSAARGLASPDVGLADTGKRIILGRKLRGAQLAETLLPKRVALPVFASDALSSVAYSPDETPGAVDGRAVGVRVLVEGRHRGHHRDGAVVLSYRQNVQAYASGRDYEVTSTNLGPMAGLGVGSALLVDYVLTVAVSISSAAQYAADCHHRTAGTPDHGRGRRRAVPDGDEPAWGARVGHGVRGPTCSWRPCSAWRCGGSSATSRATCRSATRPSSPSSPQEQFADGLTGFAFALLLLRAFSSGCAALTGVEAISNGCRRSASPRAATPLPPSAARWARDHDACRSSRSPT